MTHFFQIFVQGHDKMYFIWLKYIFSNISERKWTQSTQPIKWNILINVKQLTATNAFCCFLLYKFPNLTLVRSAQLYHLMSIA